MNKKIIYAGFLISLGIFFFGSLSAEAHTLESDGAVSVLMFLEPHEETLIGKPSVINLEFKSAPGVVDFSRCNCLFTLSRNDKQIFKLSLKEGEAAVKENTVYIPHTFSETGEYTLNVSGITSTSTAFSLSYPIVAVDGDHVMADEMEGHHHPAGHMFHIVLLGAAILLSSYVILKDRRRRTRV
ncbi:MAG: hypothetical protein JWL80_113 [Parcubacteria group bacterium]|nr:hypothetical protein [Parcubacteria group bacterium]